MSQPTFPPTEILKVPAGEGAFERVVNVVRAIDPTLRQFRIIAMRKAEHLEKYPELDQLPLLDSELRPPIALPLPHSSMRAGSLPSQLLCFDHNNGHEVTSFLSSLHHPIHKATNFWTYAVIILFEPGYNRSALPAGCFPPRLFSRAPMHPSFTVVAVSGNEIGLYDENAAKAYLDLFNARAYRIYAENEKAYHQPVASRQLLPCIELPEWTRDKVPTFEAVIPEPNENTMKWMREIQAHGIAMPSNPDTKLTVAAFEAFKREIFKAYVKWLRQETDYRRSITDASVHRFTRPGSYLRDRYPLLRHWFNHALSGSQTTDEPGWPKAPAQTINTPSEFDFVLGTDDEFHDLLPPADTFFPTVGAELIGFAHAYFYAFFLQRHEEAGVSHQQVTDDYRKLVGRGFLEAVLSEIGDVECQQAEEAVIGARPEKA